MKQPTIDSFPWKNAGSSVPFTSVRRLAGKLGAISMYLLPTIFLCLLGAMPTAFGNTVPPIVTAEESFSLTADLSLVKTVNDNTADQNQVVTFTIVVSNAGANPATDVDVRDVVPAGMTFVAGSQTGPGTYNSGSPGTTGVNWENLLISVGGSVTLGFQATVTGAPGSTITNFAEVFTSAETDPDSTPGNGNVGEDDGDTEVVTVNVANPPVVLTCPTNTTTAACQTQAAVDAAFSAWLATASGTGGCSGVLTNNNSGAPSACGGSTTVTFTYTSTCAPLTTTCQATFTVAAAPTVVLTCPTNTTAAACQTQAAVNTAFAAWLATASASGGCNGVLTNNNTGAPSACGGSTTVTFTYTSTCAPLTTTCQATFTVPAAPPVVLTCPTNTTAAACQTQAAVNTAFAAWLATASASGGCNGVLTNNNTGAPSACGGSTTVTFTYTSTCAPLTTTCQATFTVPASPTVVLTCPTNTTAAACQTQAAVNTAFAAWLATASASGGCNGVLTNNNTGAPSACGGSTTVTFTYTSTCAPLTTTCQATFTVAAAPTVVLTCPQATTEPLGQTQAQVDAAFATWLATASGTGGCNGVLTNNNTGAPPASGGSTTVTFTYTSSCAPLTTTCQATFTVAVPPPANDLCANAITIPGVNANICGTTLGANADTPNGGVDCPAGGSADANGAGVWYTFVGTGQTWDFFFPENGATWDPEVNVYSGSCGSLTCVTGDDDGGGGLSAQLTVNSVAGVTYYVYVHPADDFGGGTFNFCFDVALSGTPPVVLTCPTNTTAAACQTQAAVNTAFAAWLTTASASGGCSGVLTNNNTGAPSACGGSTTVTFTYTSTCAPLTTTCQATFTVAAPPTVVLTCPTNTTAAACQTQAAVNTAFAAWLATASASGGCNGVLTNNNTGAPSACGGSTTVTFTYTSSCAPLTTTCQATFTVASSPVVLTCPTNTTTAACQTQAAVNTAFATWLATASASGGCNGVLTNNNTGAPSACGGSTTVTFTYTSSCAPLTTTCQATFTVPAAPTVVLTCPINVTEPACERQDSINNRFNRWLATASGTGGCNGVLTNNNTGAPSACGGSTTVTFTYTSSCAPLTTTCQATFTVGSASAPGLTCPTPTTASACLTQAQLNTAYANWLASATVSGGCGGGTLTNNAPPAPLICNPNSNTITVTFTYTGATCQSAPVTCTSTFTVPAYPTFTVPANGAATVACPANANQPTPPTVVDGCGNTLTPAGPTITNVPNPLTCEGTRTYAWTYTDCAGLVRTWSFVYTIERLPFTVPANGSATVACPANATQPTPPTVTSNCGEVLTPTGPVITNVPNPLTCEGTRTYAWTYTDCEGNTATWSFTYTIERQPFTVPANGSATVACPDQTDVQPTPPVVTSNCGEVLTPVITVGNKPFCEGTRTYSFTYTDCEGNTATWSFTYTVEYLPFNVPASETMTVTCAENATLPTPPTVFDNCGRLLIPVGPAITGTDNNQGCEASRVYTWTYKDCEGNTRTWSKTYIINYNNSLFVPLDETYEVSCLLYAQPPLPQTLYDNCGQEVAVTGPVVEGSDNGCSGQRKYTYTYTDCAGNSAQWSFTYIANDNEPPVGQCPNVDVTNLACIGDVPCPDDYDFDLKIKELLDEGGIYDVCSGDDLKVTLDSWTDLWECSNNGDGNFTFGRTFYFRIADACGNELPSLCGVTYSGACLPIETFPQNAWGIPGGEPGTDAGQTDLEVISGLLGANNPIVIGGNNRSLTVNDAQCIVNLLPGTAGPGVLANCHQVNCTGCNPLGIGGMKNSLAANAIALNLNIRYNVQYNGLTLNALRNQRLDCIDFPQSLLYCPPTGGPCVLRIIENPGIAYDFPNTIGGLLDMVNLFLNGGLNLTKGQNIAYASALNAALGKVNAYWNGSTVLANLCNEAAKEPGEPGEKAQVPTAAAKQDKAMSLAPNPAGSFVTISLEPLEEEREAVLEIYNQFGQLVLRKDLGVIGQLNDRIDIHAFNAGVYYVSLMVGGERFEQRLLVSKG